MRTPQAGLGADGWAPDARKVGTLIVRLPRHDNNA
jgi:hypothetical protein